MMRYLRDVVCLMCRYCTQLITTEMEMKIVEFLQILTKYQERAMAERALATARDAQPKKKKRYVMGIKEVRADDSICSYLMVRCSVACALEK